MSRLIVSDGPQFVGRVQLIIYVDDKIIGHSNQAFEFFTDIEDGWHCIRLECIEDPLSDLPFEKITYVAFDQLSVNGHTAWPIEAGQGKHTPPVPFNTAQAHCYNGANGYISKSNRLFSRSYCQMYVNIVDNTVVDHYYDRGDPTNIQAYPSDAWIFDNRDPEALDKFSLIWSDVYSAYVHRMVMEDHFIVIHRPDDTSTYGNKWKGVYFEATPRAIEEALNRNMATQTIRDVALGKIKSLPPNFNFEKLHGLVGKGALAEPRFIDVIRNNEISYTQSESGRYVTCDFWPLPHIFSAYTYGSLPPEILAFILRIV